MAKILAGRCILVAEDDYMLADELAFALTRLGAQVIGPASRVADGLAAIASTAVIDAAVLDINLAGELSWPIVDALLLQRVPILLATGYDKLVMPAQYKALPSCEKPFSMQDLVGHLSKILTRQTVQGE